MLTDPSVGVYPVCLVLVKGAETAGWLRQNLRRLVRQLCPALEMIVTLRLPTYSESAFPVAFCYSNPAVFWSCLIQEKKELSATPFYLGLGRGQIEQASPTYVWAQKGLSCAVSCKNTQR